MARPSSSKQKILEILQKVFVRLSPPGFPAARTCLRARNNPRKHWGPESGDGGFCDPSRWLSPLSESKKVIFQTWAPGQVEEPEGAGTLESV